MLKSVTDCPTTDRIRVLTPDEYRPSGLIEGLDQSHHRLQSERRVPVHLLTIPLIRLVVLGSAFQRVLKHLSSGVASKTRAWNDVCMKLNHQIVVFDAAELTAESRFWAAVLDGTVDADDDWHMVLVEGKPVVAVQLAPDHVPPEWPDGTPQQIHLDLWVDDAEVAHDEVMSLGATLLKSAEERPPEASDNFRVYADPAGHPFCLCWAIKR